MNRILQSNSWAITGCCQSLCLAGMAMLIAATSHPAVAQTSSPQIAADERSDPASGDVVVINRKKKKAGAPNPYAPIKLKPLPEKWSKPEKSATKPVTNSNSKPVKKATAKPEIRQPETARRASPLPMPPLPTLNTERRTVNARLRQFPQTGLRPPPEQIDAVPPPRHAIRRPARERSARRYRDRRRYSHRHRRPWRQCRRLARRCESGLEGSCYIWQRRCT